MEGNEARLRDAAERIARACRFVVDPLLYEWEKGDCQREMEAVILAGLEEMLGYRAVSPKTKNLGQ
jgi:hypothetical protein